MAKHPKAIYFDVTGVRHELHPEDLHDTVKRSLARSNELWNETQEFRLYPRYNLSSPHFYALRPGRMLYKREEANPEHDSRIINLLNHLNDNPNLKLGFYTWDGEERTFCTLVDVSNYFWSKETYRAVSKFGCCRHDLFGASNGNQLVQSQPWIAIEVVKHHFLEEKAFKDLITLSSILPILIAFDFIDAPNYFLKIEECRVRITYYIYDGSVWNGEKRWPDERCNAAFFKENLNKSIASKNNKSTS